MSKLINFTANIYQQIHPLRPFFHIYNQYYFSHQSQKKKFFKMIDRQEQKSKNQLVLPKQYPKQLHDCSPIIPRGRPVRVIGQRQVSQLSLMPQDDVVIKKIYNQKWKSPQNSFVLNVGIIGPANSGKSALFSKLSSQVSAISPKKGTTSQVIHSYKTYQLQSEEGVKNIQLKYFDTPGVAINKTGFMSKGWQVLGQIDFSLLVVDSAKKFDQVLKQSIQRLQKHRNYQKFMKALVLNKIDLVDNKRKFHGLIAEIQKHGKFDKIFYTSSATGYGVSQIQQYLQKMTKKGQWQCPKQVYTDMNESDIVNEMMRQAIFHRTYNQVPYNILIQTQALNKKSNGVVYFQFKIIVQDQNQQRMLIGTKGRNVNWARQYFRTLYAKMYGLESEVHVRVVYKKKIKTLVKDDIEQSYYKQKTLNQLQQIRQNLLKTGKFIN